MHSFPLRLGGVRLGALTLYEPTPGGLSDDQHADALVMAGVVTEAILSSQAHAPLDTLSPELELLAEHGAELHQATGMVSVQLGVSVAEALVRLRGHAYAGGRLLSEVAADVVARRLVLESEHGTDP